MYTIVVLDNVCLNVVAVHLLTQQHRSRLLPTAFLSFYDSKEVIAVGDFNLLTLKWNNDSTGSSPDDLEFLDCLFALGLTQWVRQPTFTVLGNILDIVLTVKNIGLVIIMMPMYFP